MILTSRRDQVCAKESSVDWGKPAGGAAESGRRPAKRLRLLRSDRPRLELNAQRLGNAGAVCGIGSIKVSYLALNDLDRHAFHRRPDVLE
jgi:hypothetical protein